MKVTSSISAIAITSGPPATLAAWIAALMPRHKKRGPTGSPWRVPLRDQSVAARVPLLLYANGGVGEEYA